MKLSLRGKGNFSLGSNDFVTSGGEAKIYRRGKLIYKIYHKESDMIPDSKIEELQEIKEPNVLIPKDIILNSKGARIGFTMDFVDKVVDLCKLFTNSFITQNNVNNNDIIDLVKHMQETIQHVHSAGCIQVDGNELNYLVEQDTYKTCYFIDTNAYQTKSFPATVIMPSIRDWTAKEFNELTDWYSFAIIACQLFVGIHPFKGKHQDFKRHDMENRMKANISIFNKNTRVPKSVRDYSRIPSNYMEWFMNLFENGKRELPPSTVGAVSAKVQYIVVSSTDNFNIELIQEFEDEILHHSNPFMIPVTKTKSSIYVGTTQYKVSKGVYLVHTPKKQIPVGVKIEDGIVMVKSFDKNHTVDMSSPIAGEEIMAVGSTIYIKQGGNFIETQFVEGQTIHMVSKTNWPVSENSSQLFKNLIVQNLLGSIHISIPVPLPGNSEFYTSPVPELNDYKVIDAKYENRVAVLSVFNQKTLEYGMVVIRGLKTLEHDVRWIKVDNYNEVNFVTLDNGITVLIYDDKMELFQHNKHYKKVKVIKDKELSSNMILCKKGVKLRFFTNNKLYKMAMK